MNDPKSFDDIQREQLAAHNRSLQDFSQALPPDAPPEALEAIRTMQAASDPSQVDPDMMMVMQLRGVMQLADSAGADYVGETLEASARDGGPLVLLARINPAHLAGLRAVAQMTGSYEAALHVVLDSFGKQRP